MYICKYPHLFEPIQIGNRVFRNRIFNSPTGTHYQTLKALPTEEAISHYERKAMGGAATVCVGDSCVDKEISFHGTQHIESDDWYTGKAYMTKLADKINRHGAIASLELVHAGGCASGSYSLGHTIYGPVDMSYTARGQTTVAIPMTEEIIERTINKFAISAKNAKDWGFGMVTIHGGHGWLLSQFMSPTLNTRTDKWGGTFENRMRLPIAICDAIRKAVGPGFPIEIRISGAECFDGGYDIDYGIEIAKALDEHVDIIHVSTGSHENDDTFTITHPSMFLEDGCNVKYAAAIKPHIKHAKIATVGALSDPAMMEEIIASGKADIVQMARGMICDPDIPVKARTGREDEIRHCMRCFDCFGSLIYKGHITCAQNPETSYEDEFRYAHVPAKKKKVLVIGGGVGGMQAAVTASEQGHEVILCEAKNQLGGILRCEKDVPFKIHMEQYLDYQAKLVSKSSIDVRLNTPVTPEYAQQLEPDVIICAMGAEVSKPPIPGLNGSNVLDVTDCYEHPEKAGNQVVILGGGLSGIELSIYLQKHLGKKCTVLEMAPELEHRKNFVHALALNVEFKQNGINIQTGTKCTEITAEGVWAEKDGEKVFYKADTVVNALGLRSHGVESISFSQCAPEYYLIGDCNTPRNIQQTVAEAYHVAMDLGRT